MKKGLLMILSAALLLVGCTGELEDKVGDLTSRVENLESQVAANKAAIEALQKADFITKVEETEAGWSITLSNGKVLTLYHGQDGANGKDGANGQNGADGKDGDAFFKSVVVNESDVVFTLTDGTSITVPFIVEFDIELLTQNLAVKADSEVRIPYRVKGATKSTVINVLGSGDYWAENDAEESEIVIYTPSVLGKGRILVAADNGAGKSAIKCIDLDEQVLDINYNVSVAAQYWSGAYIVAVASNVDVEFSTDVPWITFAGTKAVEEYNVTINVAATPASYSRTGHVYVKDPDGLVVQDIVITQVGAGKFTLNDKKFYNTWADAEAAIKNNEDGAIINGVVKVIVSEGHLAEVLNFSDTLNSAVTRYEVVRRNIGVPTCSIEGTIIDGIRVNNVDTKVTAVSLVPGGEWKSEVIFNNFGCIEIKGEGKDVQFNNCELRVDNPFSSGTFIAGQSGCTNNISFNECNINFGGERGGQVWGGNYTFNSCNISNANSGYAVRIYNTANITLKKNLIDTPVIVNAKGSGTVTLGDGTTDDNIYSANVTDISTGNVALKPGSANTGTILLNGIGFATIADAMAHASNGSVIELPEGEIDANIKVANNKAITIKGAGKNATIVNGNIEIAGSVIVKDLTLATKEGVTNNELGVKVDGDDYTWGHQYLARVENGAHDVTFENVHFVATAAVSDFNGTLSMLWVSQAKNVLVKNCTFDTNAEGSYCPNQSHYADIVWEGNVFNGGGRKGWVLRAMDEVNMTVANNVFNDTDMAIHVYGDFTGTLTFGDGITDDNYYGSSCKLAIHGDHSKFDFLANGAKFYPASVKFEANSTSGATTHKIVEVWSHLNEETPVLPDLANVRNMAMNETAFYAGSTNGLLYTVSLEDGSLVATDSTLFKAEKTGHFNLDGMTSLEDGTIVVSNMGGKAKWMAGPMFEVYTYDGAALNKVVSITDPTLDGAAFRLGDMITAVGTKDNARIFCLDYNAGGRVWVFDFPGEGVVSSASAVRYNNNIAKGNWPNGSGIGSVTQYKVLSEDEIIYYVSYDGDYYDEILLSTRWGQKQWLGKIQYADMTNKETRGAKFFTVGGEEFMAVLEMCGYDSTNSYGSKLHVYALPTGDLYADLNGATAVATYDMPSSLENGNSCANIDIVQKNGKTFIGIAIHNQGTALVEFL